MGGGTLSGGMVISRLLGRYGVRTVFALGGAQHTHLLQALADDGVRIVSGRHESGCILAADGYARVTGKPGVALTIAEQGLPNAIPGLAAAYQAGSPVVVLLARLPDSWIEAESESDAAQLELVRPVTKWARTVPSAERLAEYFEVAVKRAISGRPGPVVLQIPQDYLGRPMPAPAALQWPPHERHRPLPDRQAITRAAELLAAAERPLVICGAGATRGNAGPALRELSERFGWPVAGNGLGRGLVAEDWQRGFAWPLAQVAAKQADVVLAVGVRLKQRLGYGLPPRFAPDARFIQVDIDAAELSRNRRVEVGIHADTGMAMDALLEALTTHGHDVRRRPDWLAGALAERFAYLEAASRPADPIHPLALGRALAERLPANAIVVGDGADIQNWMYGALRIREAPGFLDHYPLGAMGIGTPLAVGAAAGAVDLAAATGDQARPVVLVTGDGSLGFHPAELHAASSAGLRLPVIVGNDGAWGTELHGQRGAIGRTVNTELGVLPYEHLGPAFGGTGEAVRTHAELGPALDRALAARGVHVVNVMIDQAAGAAVKQDWRAKMIMFDDLASNLEAQQWQSTP